MTLEIRDLAPGEIGAAAAVLGRGMLDNPLHVAAFGPVPELRAVRLAQFFTPVIGQYRSKGRFLAAWRAGALVGVCGMVRPGRCRPSWREKLQILPVVALRTPPAVTGALLRWTAAWAKHDPAAVHWHLGPVAVDRDLQGQGIGRALLNAFCAAIDAEHAAAYLETDKAANVRLYTRFGFGVVHEAPVLEVPNWFMWRAARPPR